jgi:hypothetical protein
MSTFVIISKGCRAFLPGRGGAGAGTGLDGLAAPFGPVFGPLLLVCAGEFLRVGDLLRRQRVAWDEGLARSRTDRPSIGRQDGVGYFCPSPRKGKIGDWDRREFRGRAAFGPANHSAAGRS